jgi:hypothetical protein
LLALLAACSIDARSQSFECAVDGDCPTGRVCHSNWCVLPGDDLPPADAGDRGDAAGGADAALVECSEAVCDFCDNGTCVLVCGSGGDCAGGVECPSGMPCRVICSGVGSCGGGVDCSEATGCEVHCSKSDACAGPIVCSSGPCDVACTARETCQAGVDCADSCACTTDCSGASACALPPECPYDECVAGDGDCTNGSGCDLCQ